MFLKAMRYLIGASLLKKKRIYYLTKLTKLIATNKASDKREEINSSVMPKVSTKNNAYTSLQHMQEYNDENNNFIYIPEEVKSRVKLNITGKNNIVSLKDISGTAPIYITIGGDDNELVIEESAFVGSCAISMNGDLSKTYLNGIAVNQELHIINGSNINNTKSNNSIVVIEQGTSFEQTTLWNHNSNATIHIDKSCMFAFDITFQNSDTHPIFDLSTREIINKPRKILYIGEHTWVGKSATIMKGVHIPKNTIVGTYALVSKSFEEENTVLAGNPAKVVKRNVMWDTYHCDYNQ